MFDLAIGFKILAGTYTNTSCPQTIYIKWILLIVGSYILNTNGSSHGNLGKSDTGDVRRNHSGDWVVGFIHSIYHTTNIIVELLTLQKGLKADYEHNLLPLEIAIYSTEIIHMINHGHLYYNPLILACKSLLRKLGSPIVMHNFKE